jgi:preprotein translocase subunit SecB
MSNNQTSESKPEQQRFEIQRIYLKDASFESPGSPKIFTREFKPEVQVELHARNHKLAEDVREVELQVTITVKMGDDVAYLAEVKQAGIFTAVGYSQDQMGHLLGSYCPNLLYPYVREAISDLVIKGGFPALFLAPINFDALYAQQLKEQAEGKSQTKDATKH